ncbi:putative lyase [Medicago truncatula]|uniref:(E)-beta-ocimene synthase n=1 Tax=Medicago truncatula TaxID=3880 RepID=A2Q649_MEDTR|nr:probable terpene synthase 2 [Medicago truncatula]ABN09069.1 Terpene synthase-like; Terpenoid synthase [Medicago truncatula]AES66808.1 terpene synthase family, metal-binding domain protein [Medicago truncatula]RHN75243.1 putative lyase [Medicago truncatula]
MESLAAPAPVDIKRPIVDFSPSIWGDVFLQYDSQPMEINDNMKTQVQMQKEEVRKIFQSSSNDISQKLNFIDSLQRLGISYHFEREIDEALEQIHKNLTKNKEITTKEGSLHFLALEFRLLRKKGYHISSDEIFEKFKNNKGSLNENISKDVQGMWSLYEAAQLRIHDEDILDEALDFTYSHLNSLITNELSPFLAKQLCQCLRTPLHKGVPRLETRCYISSYGEEPSHSKVLLNFAKLDFNTVQKMHQNEIGSITKWWKDSEFATNVPYARDRVAEAYFWPLAMSYEPKYSTARKMVGKLVTCVSLLDDTYDAYGTVEELELFTEAMQRWDINVIQSLPESMKVVFNSIVELCDEIETTIVENGTSSLVFIQYVKQNFYKLARSYFVESKWCSEGYIPTYDEYKANGSISSSYPLQILSFIGLGEFSNDEILDWIFNYPTIIDAISAHGRLADDISSHKFEQERVHVASAVECCMKQYDMSGEEAYNFIRKEIENYWKVMNEECLKLDNIPRPVLEFIMNVARVTEFAYENFEDKYTKPELLKDYIVALLVDPISIELSE